ncbi:MAG: PLP-dependent cysteine synthase family protein [Xanthomonadales bacterium]|nr:PLP-dependent cysteine synthase family protein [Gammaproteobacteria bacterium]MBT8050303.1 PLP-dependent cysteine synthase family protein [Gammaproteobacteria bacterium]MBT8055808.1 PLP-dependent cysteine synthase family protein [Gammaproteobacteria bacterium]NNJ79784.1 PLP-dependent cysteine synthase family protein [Xanthomonadales bacterium]NNL04212.1 PLP-dependent cysteine synthase family protein [Xanthomonadales bacterium]
MNPSEKAEVLDVASRPEDGPPKRVYENVTELVADPENPTPMIRISRRFNPHKQYELFVKLERNNPFGSIKDRTALFLLNGLELEEGQVLAEPTAGNTGIALAALANARGMPIELALPEGTPEEKKALLRFLGAELLEVEDELCPLFPTEGARGVVKSLVESEAYNGRYVSPNQYENELNVEAHYRTTGPEIWNQTGGEVEYFFAAFGTCGTITGVGRYLKERNPKVKIIGIEPASRNHRLSGIKKISNLPDEHKPKILDYSLLDDIIEVEDHEAFDAAIEAARSEGLMVGPTTGALLHAARVTGATNNGTAVVISPDDATKYISQYGQYLAEKAAGQESR